MNLEKKNKNQSLSTVFSKEKWKIWKNIIVIIILNKIYRKID